MRRCASAPSLRQIDGGGYDVYICTRQFKNYAGCSRFPRPIQRLLEDAGVCHYMAVFRHSVDGSLHCFDFGPPGGDIVLPPRAERARGFFLRRSPRREVNGEIRVSKLLQLPADHILVGRTQLSLEDIRSFNSVQQVQYELHKNDCRHYVDNVVQYSTGMRKAAALAARQQFRRRRAGAAGQLRWSDRILQLGTLATDVGNWGRIRMAGQATLAAAAGFMGRATLLRLHGARALLPAIPARAVLVRPTAQRLGVVTRRPVSSVFATATATAAAASWQGRPVAEMPVLRDALQLGSGLAEGMRGVMRSTGSLARLTTGLMPRLASRGAENASSKGGVLQMQRLLLPKARESMLVLST